MAMKENEPFLSKTIINNLINKQVCKFKYLGNKICNYGYNYLDNFLLID